LIGIISLPISGISVTVMPLLTDYVIECMMSGKMAASSSSNTLSTSSPYNSYPTECIYSSVFSSSFCLVVVSKLKILLELVLPLQLNEWVRKSSWEEEESLLPSSSSSSSSHIPNPFPIFLSPMHEPPSILNLSVIQWQCRILQDLIICIEKIICASYYIEEDDKNKKNEINNYSKYPFHGNNINLIRRHSLIPPSMLLSLLWLLRRILRFTRCYDGDYYVKVGLFVFMLCYVFLRFFVLFFW
jgi:hypothetical protein